MNRFPEGGSHRGRHSGAERALRHEHDLSFSQSQLGPGRQADHRGLGAAHDHGSGPYRDDFPAARPAASARGRSVELHQLTGGQLWQVWSAGGGGGQGHGHHVCGADQDRLEPTKAGISEGN